MLAFVIEGYNYNTFSVLKAAHALLFYDARFIFVSMLNCYVRQKHRLNQVCSNVLCKYVKVYFFCFEVEVCCERLTPLSLKSYGGSHFVYKICTVQKNNKRNDKK